MILPSFGKALVFSGQLILWVAFKEAITLITLTLFFMAAIAGAVLRIDVIIVHSATSLSLEDLREEGTLLLWFLFRPLLWVRLLLRRILNLDNCLLLVNAVQSLCSR